MTSLARSLYSVLRAASARESCNAREDTEYHILRDRYYREVDVSHEVKALERRIRFLLVGFIVGLILSGLTAFPLPQEARLLAGWLNNAPAGQGSQLAAWILRVSEGLNAAEARYPFLLYGTDWLAFAHLVIAIMFVGPLRDPVRNVWVVHWGLLACVGVLPLALICGPIRGIPFFWQLIDCSFGVVGIVPLFACARMIRKLERLRESPGRA